LPLLAEGAFTKEAGGNEPSLALLKTQSLLMAADSMHRMATAWEQASVILFLLSDEASNLTGAIYATDGCWTVYQARIRSIFYIDGILRRTV